MRQFLALTDPGHAILRLYLDTFFVSVEPLLDSRLQVLRLLVGGTRDRGVQSRTPSI